VRREVLFFEETCFRKPISGNLFQENLVILGAILGVSAVGGL